jgi:hypothetical protein
VEGGDRTVALCLDLLAALAAGHRSAIGQSVARDDRRTCGGRLRPGRLTRSTFPPAARGKAGWFTPSEVARTPGREKAVGLHHVGELRLQPTPGPDPDAGDIARWGALLRNALRAVDLNPTCLASPQVESCEGGRNNPVAIG